MSAAGCHDNRMDKIWWNEQWMGWPIGPEYAESSNVDNAYRLQGKVLLVVGEMDHNVDPSSTMQVVNQLIKHNKDFDLLVVPGHGHGSGGAYGDHKRYDFFVRHLLGVKPPEWKLLEEPAKPATTAAGIRGGRTCPLTAGRSSEAQSLAAGACALPSLSGGAERTVRRTLPLRR